MKELIISIFRAFGFATEDVAKEILFFQPQDKEQVEYYLVQFITAAQLAAYSGNDAFNILQSEKPQFRDADKNTSLILCVEFKELKTDCPQHKNAMLQIEEDEFWFKKYLLAYTANAVTKFTPGDQVISQINAMVNEEQAFDRFNQHIYEDEGYFLGVQLFLKIPFLGMTTQHDRQFVTIEQMLVERLSAAELQLLYERIAPHPNEPDEWEQLRALSLNPKTDNLDQFLTQFFGDAQA